MTYRVRYMPRAMAAIDEQVGYLLSERVSRARVSAWLSELYELAASLEEFPSRFAVDAEMSTEVGVEVRRIVFGNYLIFYRVDETRQRVDVVHFRHAAQRPHTPDDDD